MFSDQCGSPRPVIDSVVHIYADSNSAVVPVSGSVDLFLLQFLSQLLCFSCFVSLALFLLLCILF